MEEHPSEGIRAPAGRLDALEAFEPLEPTALVKREKVGAVKAEPEVLYAGCKLVRELLRAPGAIFAEGLNEQGLPRLLQMVHLRATPNGGELIERRHYEQTLLRETAELLKAPELVMEAHGAVTEPDGGRVLVWVLPWPKSTSGLARAQLPAYERDQILDIAATVCEGLIRTHQRDGRQPLLSERLVIPRIGQEPPQVLGLPLFVRANWLAADMVGARLAPEERFNEVLTSSGDIWRLGQTLRALVDAAGLRSTELEDLIDELSYSDPNRRILRASQVLVELEALKSMFSSAQQANTVSAATTSLAAIAPGELAGLMLLASGDSTQLEAASPPSGALSTLQSALRLSQLGDRQNRPQAETLLDLHKSDVMFYVSEAGPRVDATILERPELPHTFDLRQIVSKSSLALESVRRPKVELKPLDHVVRLQIPRAAEVQLDPATAQNAALDGPQKDAKQAPRLGLVLAWTVMIAFFAGLVLGWILPG